MNIRILLLALVQWGLAMDDRIAIIVPEYFPTAFVGNERAIPFKPTVTQVKIVEKELKAYLKSKHPGLHKKFQSYYRQYSGLETTDGQKSVSGNFLCKVDGDRWRKEWIVVQDGGDCYFNFSFDVKKSSITDFSINGEA